MDACEWRGHNMGEWQKHPQRENVESCECKRCDAQAYVILEPWVNEIDIGGGAVAVGCRDKSVVKER